MDVNLYNIEGKTEKKITLPQNLEKLGISHDLIHQVVSVGQKNRRRHWAHAKDRSEVSGGGKKPWRQKGTGRARHGSNRSPIWRGGGITFGPVNRKTLDKKINKKMQKLALWGILKTKIIHNDIFILNELPLNESKTKKLETILKKILAIKKTTLNILLIVEKIDQNLKLASKNIPYLKVTIKNNIDSEMLIRAQKIIIMEKCFKDLLDTIPATKN